MARDLAGWADELEREARREHPWDPTGRPANDEVSVGALSALAALLRAVAVEHHPEPGDDDELYCSGCGLTALEGEFAWQDCRTVPPILAALAPLAPLFPEEGGGDGA